MNLNSYLHKRDHSQAWQLRWMVPKAARPLIGKAEFTKSLRVTDRTVAEGLAYGAHSFRHGLADQLRLAGYLDDEIEVALGHNQVSVTGGYGQVRQGTVARIAAMIENVTFDGVDFSVLPLVITA